MLFLSYLVLFIESGGRGRAEQLVGLDHVPQSLPGSLSLTVLPSVGSLASLFLHASTFGEEGAGSPRETGTGRGTGTGTSRWVDHYFGAGRPVSRPAGPACSLHAGGAAGKKIKLFLVFLLPVAKIWSRPLFI
uniref:Uncharacterized protein n=1 Tax=Morchella brunnea TaxID=1174671 RepID=A0A8K1I7P6_9PEZI|nr:hypothetical protein LK370_mgp063 [Morchella brunnea]UBU98453.1 hypothetical protein [Morchella brunnea]